MYFGRAGRNFSRLGVIGARHSVATNSLAFASASSQSLTQTGKITISQQKFTVSFWLKRASTGTAQQIMYLGDGTASNTIGLLITSGDLLRIFGITATVTVLNLITTQTFTDTTNWHHVLFAIDTTQATSTNRAQVYYDGTLISSFGTAVYPNQNTNLSNNFAAAYRIGANQTPTAFVNGKFSQFYYIDGQQLTPTSFITGTPGVPKNYSGTYTGVFDFFLNFSNGASLGADSSGEGNNWTLVNSPTQSADHP